MVTKIENILSLALKYQKAVDTLNTSLTKMLLQQKRDLSLVSSNRITL
jgi:hypothetical protein